MRNALGIAALTSLFAYATLTSAGAETATTSGWRFDGSGRYVDAQPPTKWAKDSPNILWKVELERGYSSPVLCPGEESGTGRLFLLAEPSDVVCIDAATGNVLWRQKVGYAAAVGEAEAERIVSEQKRLESECRAVGQQYNELRKANLDDPQLEALQEQRKGADERRREFEREYPPERRGGAGNAAATVLCDGRRVFALFGTGIVAALELDGKLLWVRHVEATQQGFGHSASPVLAGGRLIVHIKQLVALDPDTGKVQWRTDVPAKFGTPAVASIAGKDLVITPSGAVVAADDGRVLAERQFQMSENSPIVHDGVLFVHEAGKIKAFRLPDSFDAPFALAPLWESSGARDQRMASAVYHDGLLYAGGRGGIMDVVDATTGELVYRKRLVIGELFSSPTLAGDLIYYAGRGGQMLVLRPGRKFDEVAVNELDRLSTTPLFAGKRMYLRAERYLYCIGQ